MENTYNRESIVDLSLLAFVAAGGYFLLFVSGVF